MREIKYKAWDKDRKSMSEPMTIAAWMFDAYQETKRFGDVEDEHLKSFFEKLIFLQFTGLKDKNGKEIYEGDVVRMIGGASERGFVYDVYYTNAASFSGFAIKGIGRTGKMNYYQHWTGRDAEIIGNIYENPQYAMSV